MGVVVASVDEVSEFVFTLREGDGRRDEPVVGRECGGAAGLELRELSVEALVGVAFHDAPTVAAGILVYEAVKQRNND